ncbi:MAG: hypothetical protein JRN06_01480 [Nitrososphaerota archaeon]|nr:hypothetical protein [Nitrososphaerota archaeon]MDG7023476.1 hypothetical protein [Nitrososphaerota archaeon]
MLLQQVLKLNCETCRLKTEHYVQIWNGMAMMCRCLKCGKVRMKPQLTREELRPYPADESKPVYVC